MQKQNQDTGGAAAKVGGKTVRFCVNWGGQLEPFAMASSSTFEQLASITAGPVNAPKEHKLMIVKGRLQLHTNTLQDAGLRDGSIVHLVLNDAPERIQRKPLHVQHFATGARATVMCEAEEWVEGVKEELDGREGMPPFSALRLAFAGRLLQNQHTLREYNIQKPSVLSLLPPPPPRPLERYLSETFPTKGQEGVTLHSELSLSFRSPVELEAEGAYWHAILGAPILSTLLATDFQVREKFREELVEGRVHVDNGAGSRGGRITFVPKEALGPARHYRVTVNRNKSLWHSKQQERVQGHIAWDFFTVGYKPLRITAIYPRPHSRVPPSTPIVISFNRELYRGSDGSGWLSVGGVPLKAAAYDPATRSLVFEALPPGFPPLSSLNPRVRPDRVCGLCGESLYPLQADGLLKASTIRWRFFTTHGRSEVSRYQYNNAESAGVAPVLKRWQEGRLTPLHQLHRPLD